MLRRSFAFALIAVLNSACVRQYVRPQFDPENAQFQGIASALLTNDEVDVLFVHGMCTHDEGTWIDQGWGPEIKKTLSASLDPPSAKAASAKALPQAELIQRTYNVGHKKLRAKFLLWSPLTSPIKASSVQYDNPAGSPNGEFRWKRAWLNGKLKTQLVNDCLSDPMIYAGAAGSVIKTQVEQRICEAFSLDYDPSKPTCVGENGQPTQLPPSYIVTESLGSKIAIDAVSNLVSHASNPSPLLDSVASIPQIFMLANQLPLLGLTDQEASSALQKDTQRGSVSQDFALQKISEAVGVSRLAKTEKAASFATAARFSIVAFTDPNDLLSYRLGPADDGSIEISNVIASNAGSLFGFVAEMPTSAHTGYSTNERVMQLVLCGHQRTNSCSELRSITELNKWGP